MKILYVITKANWGGAQRYVYDLATAARAAGHEVVVAYGEPGLLVERLNKASIPTQRVPALARDISPLKEFVAKRNLRRLFEDLHPDVVHLNSSKAGYTGAQAAHKAGVPHIIFTAHGWAFLEPRSLPVRKLFEFLQYRTLRFSTQVIAVSPSVAELAPLRKLPRDRVELIPLGIHEPSYLSREAARDALIDLDPTLIRTRDELWIGTVGELTRNKGVDIGLAGWQKAGLKDAQWVIIGSGEEGERLKGISVNTLSAHFLGFVADAAQYMKAFDLLLVPSRTEALGYAILEAGMAGVPVLTTGVGGTKDAVGPEYPLVMTFFKSEDAASLAEMLCAATRDRENLARVGKTLEQHVRATFSFERMVRQTLALYRR